MDKPKTLFDHLKAITNTQDSGYWDTLTDVDKKSWSNYMINRFLSMNPEWTELINELQYITQTMSPRDVYRLYIEILPRKNMFLKYIKGKGQDKYESWLVDLIKTHYDCGISVAEDYLKILYANKFGREDIKYICELYGTDKKKIDSLKLGKTK